MERRMIVFDHGQARYNVRVAAIIRDGSRVLLQTFEGAGFWCLPGGRAELLEPAEDCLRREMCEELGEEVRVERLVWVMENFFQHEGRSYHELGLYFLAGLSPGSRLPGRSEPWEAFEENGMKMTFDWKEVAELQELRVLPALLQQGLAALPPGTEHVVWRDE